MIDETTFNINLLQQRSTSNVAHKPESAVANPNRHNTAFKCKICIVSSCGGHLTEVRALKEAYAAYEHFYVLNKQVSVPVDMEGKTYFIVHAERNWKVLINFWEAWRIIHRERPTILLSTGAGPIVPFAIVGLLYRAPTIFVETFNRVMEPSLSGRFMYRIARVFIYQWQSLEQFYPRATYGGPVV